MSILTAAAPADSAAQSSPRILSFLEAAAQSPPGHRQDVVQRARLEHRNKSCRCCGRATVEPIERDDALLDRWGEPIPGTATIAGFACNACGRDWSTERPRLSVVR